MSWVLDDVISFRGTGDGQLYDVIIERDAGATEKYRDARRATLTTTKPQGFSLRDKRCAVAALVRGLRALADEIEKRNE